MDKKKKTKNPQTTDEKRTDRSSPSKSNEGYNCNQERWQQKDERKPYEINLWKASEKGNREKGNRKGIDAISKKKIIENDKKIGINPPPLPVPFATFKI